jgi:uncharacterized protein (TIGR02679 family)
VSDAARRLNRPELAPVVDELVRRFSEGAAPVRLTLRDLSPRTRSTIADLLGLDRLPGPEFRLGVDRLRGALGVSSDDELQAIIVQLRGPLTDRRAERAARETARDGLWSWLTEEAARVDLRGLGANVASLRPWVDAQRAAGIRGGIDAHRRRLESALVVLRALPGNGISLPSFASDYTGDPHRLDQGRAVASLVLDALATVLGWERPTGAEAVRTLWEAVGVVPDPLSSAVIALGLPGGGRTPLDCWLAAAADAGEPVVLSLANLRRWPLRPLPSDARLYVVENPSLLSEAAARWWDGPPLVCSSGRPSVATTTLLRQLTRDGATALQHADFDPAGLAITQWLAQQAGTVPWRMTAVEYLAALRTSPDRTTIEGMITTTPWDPSLHAALLRERRPVYEEQIRALLLSNME